MSELGRDIGDLTGRDFGPSTGVEADPESETATAVRSNIPPPYRPPNEKQRGRAFDDAMKVPTGSFSGVTTEWHPDAPAAPKPGIAVAALPPPRRVEAPAPPPPAMIDEPSGVMLEEEDDESMVTGLREPPPAPPRPLRFGSGRTFDEPAPAAPPIVRGGTLSMQPSPDRPVPAVFPSVPPGTPEPDDAPRTYILSREESMAASRVDPRPPSASGSWPSAVGPSAPPSSMSAPPSFAPTFGPPPSRSNGTGMGQAAFGPSPPMFGPPPGDPSRGPQVADAFGPTGAAYGVEEADLGSSFEPIQLASMGPPARDLAIDPMSIERGEAAVPMGGEPFGPMGGLPVHGYGGQPLAAGERVEPARSKRPIRLYAAVILAVIAVSSLVAYATYLLVLDRRGASHPKKPVLPKDVDEMLLAATPSDLAKADAEIRKLEPSDDREVARARLEQRVLQALEVSNVAEGLDDAIAAARKGGLQDADVAYAQLAVAVLKGDGKASAAIVTAQAEPRSSDALFRYVQGIAAERGGAPDAADHYARAAELAPKLAPARVRLARLLLIEGKADRADPVVQTLPADAPARKALEALSWARAELGGVHRGDAPKLSATSAELPRALHPIFAAVALLGAPPKAERSAPESHPLLTQAIADADSPALAHFFGELAVARGDDNTAIKAAQRGIVLSAGHAASIELLGRVAIRSGKFDAVEAILAKVAGPRARATLAMIAYERGNVDALAKLAKGLGETDDPEGLVRTRFEIIKGLKSVDAAKLDRLRAGDAVAGDLAVADALLDAGAIDRAKAIIEAWPDRTTHPARALRYARLVRYQGRPLEAEKVLGVALPTVATQRERILAEAEIASSRDPRPRPVAGG